MVNEAIDVYSDNNDIDDDLLGALVERAEVAVPILLNRCVDALVASQENYCAQAEAAAAMDTESREHSRTRRQLDLAIETTAWAADQEAKIRSVLGPLQRLAAHGKECKIGHACGDHHDMQTLAIALEKFLDG